MLGPGAGPSTRTGAIVPKDLPEGDHLFSSGESQPRLTASAAGGGPSAAAGRASCVLGDGASRQGHHRFPTLDSRLYSPLYASS